MTIKDVKAGKKYQAKVGGKLTTVRVTSISDVYKGISKARHRHIFAVNIATGRDVMFRSAVKLIKEVAE